MGLLIMGMAQAVVPAHADGGGGSGSGGSGGGGGGNGRGNDDGGGHGGDDGNDDWDSASNAAERGDIEALPVILKIALANTPGKVIGVKLDHRGTSYVYRVKILAATGRKVELTIDARSRVVARVK
jgi:Peptidase propeptide and YPEB domain